MKIGLNTDSLAHLSLTETLDFAAELGLDHVEFATGGWSSAPHVNVDRLLDEEGTRRDLQAQLSERGLRISALTCSGNPLDPGPAGRAHDATTRKTIKLAALLGIERVVMMSGLPAGPGDTHPNWVVVSWPPEATQLLEWQWREAVLPYWRELSSYSRGHGVEKLCLELHAHQVVYNVPSLLRLREEIGPIVGANLDPSHLMWMGGDAIEAIRALGEAIYHVHAKDTRLEPGVALRTRLENLPLFGGDRAERAWNYVTLGDGNGEDFWRRFCATLDEVGYRDVLSIEHEDTALTPEDGVSNTVDFLRRVAPIHV
ncbi:sugar phosphate isomerase/epimerase family protein [Amycolatopsis sp. NPDC098790]|uniref:sugar phosphate isomerase/epimerase family protein n=1 Tax=Amycolatopsis sp. NPDC098790 TaxID=3363939 RepID=UPI0037FF9492